MLESLDKEDISKSVEAAKDMAHSICFLISYQKTFTLFNDLRKRLDLSPLKADGKKMQGMYDAAKRNYHRLQKKDAASVYGTSTLPVWDDFFTTIDATLVEENILSSHGSRLVYHNGKIHITQQFLREIKLKIPKGVDKIDAKY